MAFSWDGLFVLRRIDEEDPDVHNVFLHSTKPSYLTGYNTFDKAPVKASRKLFEAIPVNPPVPWPMQLPSGTEVLIGVFQLQKI